LHFSPAHLYDDRTFQGEDMARPALKNVSTTALQAELERRVSKLAGLLKLKEQVDRDIAALQSLAGRFGKVVAAEAPAKPVRKYRRRKAKVAKVVARKKGKRGTYAQTAPDFIIGLLAGGKTLTTAELKTAWKDAGRGSKVDNALTGLVKTGLVKRAKVKNGQGSKYCLAAGRPAVGKKPAVAKKGKKTFTCPTCKQTFASGMLLGSHYRAEPTHRRK